MKNDELEKCPFCGVGNWIIELDCGEWQASCSEYGCNASICDESRSQLIKKINTRPNTPQSSEGDVKGLHECITILQYVIDETENLKQKDASCLLPYIEEIIKPFTRMLYDIVNKEIK